jgi:hypothetical protein
MKLRKPGCGVVNWNDLSQDRANLLYSICSLLNDAFSVTHYIASNEMMIGE